MGNKDSYHRVNNKWGSLKWWKGAYRQRFLIHILRNRGPYVVDEEWDNLVILDACRYDVFRDLNTIGGKLDHKISRGSCTEEFLVENFSRHPRRSSFKDIVYVAANPYVSMLTSGKFGAIYPVWDYGWDERLNTVLPSVVAREALRARNEYPDKRLIVHFMQPHDPFLGSEIEGATGFRENRMAALENRPHFKDLTVWDLLERGEIARREVWSAYENNLLTVLSYVRKLTLALPGRTVVTSDHGNLFGERSHVLYPFKEFGHPERLHVRQLVLVPWLLVDSDKTIEHQGSEMELDESRLKRGTQLSKEEEKKISERLRSLGYID